MSITKIIVKWHGQMELSYVSPNQNQTPTLGLRETLAPKEEASKVSLWDVHIFKVHPKGLVGSGGQHEKS
jgi:hypothetical protein